MCTPDRHKADADPWDRLIRYVKACINDPDSIIADSIRKMTCPQIQELLRQYISIVRLYHRDPQSCQLCLQACDDGFIEMLAKLALQFDNGSKPPRFELMISDMATECGLRKHSKLYNRLALEFSWHRFKKDYLDSPSPGDENVDYAVLPQFED